MNKIQYMQKRGNLVEVPVFNGKIVNKMPELVAQGYNPISIAQIMEQRIKAWQSKDYKLSEQWGNNEFNSGDSIIYHRDGRIKIVYDSHTLRSANTYRSLKWDSVLCLSEGSFDNSNGEEFSEIMVKRFANKYLKQKEVLNNPIWLALARWDKELLKEYTNQIYLRNKNPNLMKLFISEERPNFEVERFLSIKGLDNYSNIFGYIYGRLGDDSGRLVGLFPNIKEFNSENTGIVSQFNLELLIDENNF